MLTFWIQKIYGYGLLKAEVCFGIERVQALVISFRSESLYGCAHQLTWRNIR
jgi:hypothetical protein